MASRHNKGKPGNKYAGMTNYRRKMKRLGTGDGAHVHRKKRSWWEQGGKSVAGPLASPTLPQESP